MVLQKSFFLAKIPFTPERTYKPHHDYQNFSQLANETNLNRQKYAILQSNTDPLALECVRNGTKVSLMGTLMGFVMGL